MLRKGREWKIREWKGCTCISEKELRGIEVKKGRICREMEMEMMCTYQWKRV